MTRKLRLLIASLFAPKDMQVTQVTPKRKYSDIRLYVYFTMNFDYYFIEDCWGKESVIAKHLRAKFSYYSSLKNNNASDGFNTFYCNLDSGNQAKLEAYILRNFKG